MNSISTRLSLLSSLSALALAGCGGGSLASVGGTVSGLDANKTLQLSDQSGDLLTVSSNGSFTMQSTLSSSSNYQTSATLTGLMNTVTFPRVLVKGERLVETKGNRKKKKKQRLLPRRRWWNVWRSN